MHTSLILGPHRPRLVPRLQSALPAGTDHELVDGLLVVRGERAALDALVLEVAARLSPADAAATRVLLVDGDVLTAPAASVLRPALAADTLSTIAARAEHAPLLDALAAGDDVHVMYQPIVEVRSRRRTGFEALLRLHFGGQTVAPLEVFEAAARSGRLAEADAAARRAAIAGAKGWLGSRTLFLNLHADAIGGPEDLDLTDAAVADARLEASDVAFEAAVPADGDTDQLSFALGCVRERGYSITLDEVTDDPGAIALITELRPMAVKLAPSLVHQLPSPAGVAAVSRVLDATRAVGGRAVAKAIETSAQLDAVRALGVEEAQGWQIGKPTGSPG